MPGQAVASRRRVRGLDATITLETLVHVGPADACSPRRATCEAGRPDARWARGAFPPCHRSEIHIADRQTFARWSRARGPDRVGCPCGSRPRESRRSNQPLRSIRVGGPPGRSVRRRLAALRPPVPLYASRNSDWAGDLGGTGPCGEGALARPDSTFGAGVCRGPVSLREGRQNHAWCSCTSPFPQWAFSSDPSSPSRRARAVHHHRRQPL